MVIWRKNCLNGFAVPEPTILQWIVIQHKRRLIKLHRRWELDLNL
jgi:hypothetical protein